MFGAILALSLLAGVPSTPSPETLVAELGSPRYLDRESAEGSLAELGRSALPALRAAVHARDPEVRIRSSALLARIERDLLLQPTLLHFDLSETPIVEAVRSINRQSGLPLLLLPEDDPSWASTLLTIRSPEPFPFWKGIDALCEAGRLHYVFGSPVHQGRGDAGFPLYQGHVPAPEPVSDSGPFRVHLASVHYQSEIQLSRPTLPTLPNRGGKPASPEEPTRPASVATRQFYLQLALAAEPRLSVSQNGMPQVIEAIDHHGKSLRIPAEPSGTQRSSGYFGMNPSSLVRFRVDLAYPESPGGRIQRLRGTMPVIVATRKPEPLKVPLKASAGKTFRSPDIELTVRAEPKPSTDGQPSTIELTLKTHGESNPIAAIREVDPLAARLESPQQQLEILDVEGEPIPWFPSSSSFDGEETRLTLRLVPRTGSAIPSTIAYHGMIRAATEVPFEFADVPIP